MLLRPLPLNFSSRPKRVQPSQGKPEGKKGDRDKRELVAGEKGRHVSFIEVAHAEGICVHLFMTQMQSLSLRPSPKLDQVSLLHLPLLQETCHQQKL